MIQSHLHTVENTCAGRDWCGWHSVCTHTTKRHRKRARQRKTKGKRFSIFTLFFVSCCNFLLMQIRIKITIFLSLWRRNHGLCCLHTLVIFFLLNYRKLIHLPLEQIVEPFIGNRNYDSLVILTFIKVKKWTRGYHVLSIHNHAPSSIFHEEVYGQSGLISNTFFKKVHRTPCTVLNAEAQSYLVFITRALICKTHESSLLF